MHDDAPGITCAIETSSTLGSVALLSDENVLAEKAFAKGLRHGTDLVPTLDTLTRSLNLEPRSITLVVVGTGPGSYTGLRVGTASAKALAFALHTPLVGAASSDAAVYALAPRPGQLATVVVDAKRDYVYLSLYRADAADWLLQDTHHILPPADAAKVIPPGTVLLGDGAQRYRDVFEKAGLVVLDGIDPTPAAAWVGRLGFRKYRKSGVDELLTVEPLYLRLSEAEERRKSHSTT